MKKILFLSLTMGLLAACQSEPQFSVSGKITGADGKKLYLELNGLDGIVGLDSVKLKSDGGYEFHSARPESPEFYRLRLDNQVINFSIDSTETVTINAPFQHFATAYNVSGSSGSQKIKEITLKQIKLQTAINDLAKTAHALRMRYKVHEDSLRSLLNAYKDDIKKHYIFPEPYTTSAYYALFLKVNNFLVFDPLNNRDDVRCFAAVATSFDQRYPHSSRSKNLYNMALKGMKNTRKPKEKKLEIPADKIKEAGLININLQDYRGVSHQLTDLKGKVVMLDFNVFQSTVGLDHNSWLREIYDKYASQGLQIYQVSLDADEHYWRTRAGALPWICVRDPEGVYSSTLHMYNVQNIPTYFLISRDNELRARSENVTDIEAALKSLLK